MTKRAKILIWLTFILLLLILYLILTAEPIRNNKQPENDLNKTKIEELNENYKSQAKLIFDKYLNLIESKNYTVDQIKQIKSSLLELKVPTNFKNLHINLVLALTKMENYLSGGQESEKMESQQIINQAKANYSWLYN